MKILFSNQKVEIWSTSYWKLKNFRIRSSLSLFFSIKQHELN